MNLTKEEANNLLAFLGRAPIQGITEIKVAALLVFKLENYAAAPELPAPQPTPPAAANDSKVVQLKTKDKTSA